MALIRTFPGPIAIRPGLGFARVEDESGFQFPSFGGINIWMLLLLGVGGAFVFGRLFSSSPSVERRRKLRQAREQYRRRVAQIKSQYGLRRRILPEVYGY